MPVGRRRCHPLLGTLVEIAVEHEASPQVDAAINAAFDAVEHVDTLMSFHNSASEVSTLNRLAAYQDVQVSLETYQVLQYAKELYECSEGIFDIAVGSELADQGLLPNHAFLRQNYSGRTGDIELSPENSVRFLRPLCIDLGGIAKGFAVDQAVKVLQRHGFENGLVNAGGDLSCFGVQEQPVMIRSASVSGEMISQPVLLRNTAVATSSVRAGSGSLRSLAAAAHVYTSSGKFLKDIKTVSVLAQKCVWADALTKIVLLGTDEIMRRCLSRHKARAWVFDSDGQFEKEMN